QPNIQRLGNSGRILVELPGVKEPDRVRKLLQGTASLEFWKTFDYPREVYPWLEEANRLIRDINAAANVTEEAETSLDSLLQQNAAQDWAQENPLFMVLNPHVDGQRQLVPGPCIGLAHYRDTATVMAYLRIPAVRALFPRDFRPIWGVKPYEHDKSGVMYDLVAIKADARDGQAPLDGAVVTDARKGFGNTGGSPQVDMAMNAVGAKIWAQLTKEAFGPDEKGITQRCIAIVLDGAVYSYPRVNGEITGGRSAISGNFTVQEADDLANVLKSGKLPAPAHIIAEAVVGPSLGQESINAGMMSFLLAFVMVLLYMILFYYGAGVVANFALITNVVFLFGALASFGAVLTLPGIAGIVLTLGMAVDANVIIYERVKEELRAGKSLRMAVTDGYKNAYSAIIDGNLTTIITGIVLFFFGSGPIQGFATTLVVGIITSMITSIFVTRLIFEARLAKGKHISFATKFTKDFLANTKINFMSIRRQAYIFSGSALVICFAFIFVKGFSFGVDFTGGRTYVVRFDQQVSLNDVRSAVTAEFEGASEVKQFGAESQVKITTTYMIEDESSVADSLIDRKLYVALNGFFSNGISLPDFLSTLENPNGIISSEKVGPTIAADLKRNSVFAVIFALFAIFLYIAARFRNWSWGLGGLISIAHDTVIVLGFYAIFSGVLPFTLDVDQTFIAAVLTIIGYSINDSVVIFDRIREYHTLFPKRELFQNINEALNSTLSRTVNTAGTTLVVLIMIAIFGGEVIRGFALALSLGVIVGTYSSIFVGTPIVYDLHIRKGAKKIAGTKK
ncbi:MAG: protein translocase subunit SecDF, partial [Bacteroidales bacterium]|nr:protein translocase subunit SecDF [Bacteroidales bacterium]